MQWNKQNEYYEGKTNNFKIGKKIASFDLDGTLIVPRSNKKFPIDSFDWKWLYQNTKQKIKKLYDTGYTIVIISNQAGISSEKQSGDDWIEKINNISKDLEGIEFIIYCSIGKNKYRKPLTTIWDEFIKIYNNKDSFYCGDAVGRDSDFSDTDYKFAKNIKLTFYTPEHLFLEKENIIPEIKYCFDIDKNKKNNIKFEPQKRK